MALAKAHLSRSSPAPCNALLPALNLSSGTLQTVYGIVILVTVSMASEAAPKLLFWRRFPSPG